MPNEDRTDVVVLSSNNAAEDTDLENSISAYLADQTELDKDRPPDAMSKLPPAENPYQWDFSPFLESTESSHRKKVRKRRRKHIWKRLSNADIQLASGESPDTCLDDGCEATQANLASKRTDSSTDSDYRDYSMHGDVEHSTSRTLHDDKKSQNEHQLRNLSHKRNKVRNYNSKVAKSLAPLARKTSVLLSDRHLNAMEEHILPRALPPGLPPEILARIKAMKAKGKHGSHSQGLPKASPPVAFPASSVPKQPSFPMKMPSSSPKVSPKIQALIDKARQKAGEKSPGRWGNTNKGSNRKTPGIPSGISGKANGMPSPVPLAVPPGMPAGMPPAMPPGMPAVEPPGMPPGIPPWASSGMPVGVPPGMPVGAPPGMPVGFPPGMPVGVPPGMPVGAPPGMPAGVPLSMPAAMLPPRPAAGPAPGLPPSLPAGLSATGGGPAGPLPAPIEDFSWLKASLKVAVDKEAVSAALQKAVAKQSAPERLLGAVRPRLAAAFFVQYSATDCSEVAAFKGAFPGQATSSVCLICQPGGRDGAPAAAAAATEGSSDGRAPIPPDIQALMNQAAARQAAQGRAGPPPGGMPGMPPGVPPGMVPGMQPGRMPGRQAARKRRNFSTRIGSGRLVATAGRWRRQAGRCVPICELRDVRVKCTSNEASHALTVVGTAVASPVAAFHKCSAKCEREWELLLQFAAAERLRAYFLSGREVRAGAAVSRPVSDSWQVEKVLRCGSSGLTLQRGLCYPAGNWAVRAILSAQNSGTLGLAALAGAGGLALLVTFGLLVYFKVLKLPAFGGKKKAGGGGGGGGGEKLGEGGAGTVEFVDEPPPPPPPAE